MGDLAVKIGHYIPAYNEQIHSHIFLQATQDAVSVHRAGHDFMPFTAHSCDLIAMRNRALNAALTRGLDFLFMQDSDVFSPLEGGPVMPLLATALETDATIAGACVSMRTNPPRANVWPCHPGRVYEADKIGTGMILINLGRIRDWYDAYEGPCFQRQYADDRCIDPQIGSDIFFSYVVRGKGGRIVCDARIPTVHVNGVHRLPFDGEQVPDLAESMDTDLAEPRVATGA